MFVELIVHALQEELLHDRLCDDLIGSGANAHLLSELTPILDQWDQGPVGMKSQPPEEIEGLHDVTDEMEEDEFELVER